MSAGISTTYISHGYAFPLVHHAPLRTTGPSQPCHLSCSVLDTTVGLNVFVVPMAGLLIVCITRIQTMYATNIEKPEGYHSRGH